MKMMVVFVSLDAGEGFGIGSIQAVHSSSAAGTTLGSPGVIDRFQDDLATVTSDTTLNGAMLGGQVELQMLGGLNASFAIAGGVGELSGATSGGSGTFQLIYGGSHPGLLGLSDVDFTGGGANTRFTIDLASVTGSINIAVYVTRDGTNFSVHNVTGISEPGPVHFPFSQFDGDDVGGDLKAGRRLMVLVGDVDTGDEFGIRSILATAPPPNPDTVRPTIKLLKKKKLKNPRGRHKIKGLARDNAAVAKVEVRVKRKGWRRAKLRANGRWKFRTPRLESGRKNKFKIRAEDASGNRSRVKKVKAMGR